MPRVRVASDKAYPGRLHEERVTKPADLRAAILTGALLKLPDGPAVRKQGLKLPIDSRARMRSYFCASPKTGLTENG
jgi:hypothetical protein